MANRNFTPRKPENFIEGQDFSKEDSVSVDSTNSEEVQSGKTDSEVSFTESAIQESKKPTSKVRVKTNVDHTCTIGGTRYIFKKGVQQNVPEGVKDRLLRAGLLMPL